MTVLLFAGIAGAATLLGIALVWWKQDVALRYSRFINSFAAGALITIALLSLVPEAMELSRNAMLVVLASFIAFYLLETALVIQPGLVIHLEGGCEREGHSKGPVIFAGLFVHSLVDGFVIAAGFAVSAELGLLASAGVILHEVPEGVASFALLMRSMSRTRAFVLSLAVALATPVGAAVALGPLSGLSTEWLGMMLGVAGGSFLYVAATDLIPETHEAGAVKNAGFLLLGCAFFFGLSMLFG